MTDKEIKELYNDKLPLLRQCDLVLFNGNENLVGLVYDNSKSLAPIIRCAYNGKFTYLVHNILKDYGVPCVEAKLLTKALSQFSTGYELTYKYYKLIAKYYRKIEFLDIDSKEAALKKDITEQHIRLEREVYKCALGKAVKNFKISSVEIYDINTYLKCELKELCDLYSYKLSIANNSSFYSSEFTLSSRDDYDNPINNYVFVSKDKSSIYIANKSFFYEVTSNSDVPLVIDIVRAIMSAENKELRKSKRKYHSEFDINQKSIEIATAGIISFLYFTRVKYKYEATPTVMVIYLEKKKTVQKAPKRMYKICITYKEFLRNPRKFSEFVENPVVFEKWNFWCKELKYREDCFLNK